MDYILGGIILIVIIIVIIKLIRDKKTGKSKCGGDCSSCTMCNKGEDEE